MAERCSDRLTQLGQGDSTLHEANPKRGVPACLPLDLTSVQGVPRKLIPQLSSLVVGLVTCCPAFHVLQSPGPSGSLGERAQPPLEGKGESLLSYP